MRVLVTDTKLLLKLLVLGLRELQEAVVSVQLEARELVGSRGSSRRRNHSRKHGLHNGGGLLDDVVAAVALREHIGQRHLSRRLLSALGRIRDALALLRGRANDGSASYRKESAYQDVLWRGTECSKSFRLLLELFVHLLLELIGGGAALVHREVEGLWLGQLQRRLLNTLQAAGGSRTNAPTKSE